MELKFNASFDGSDMVVFIDNEIQEECDHVFINTDTKEIKLRACLFSTLTEKHSKLTALKYSKMLIVFLNEYGESMYRVFSGLKFSHEKIEYGLNNTSHNSYVFKFRNSTSYKKYSNLSELRKEVFAK